MPGARTPSTPAPSASTFPRDWKDDLRRRHIRVVCIRSQLRPDDAGVRLYACVARRPGTGAALLWRRDIDSLADVHSSTGELGVEQPPGPDWEVADERIVLVCTNGRHDQCCANRGRPVLRALHDSPLAGRVWECSHIGGDRFAANVVVLPDSLYFGRVEPDAASTLIAALDTGTIDLAHFRGRTSYTLAEQAVEHFVRSELDLDGVEAVVVEQRLGDGAFRVRIADGVDTTAVVLARIRRQFVSVAEPLTCKGTPEQLVPVYTLESLSPEVRGSPAS